MQLHLNEVSKQVDTKAHAVVLMDRAGWHSTGKLKIPKNLTIILLPPKSPELNPVENIWQYLRANYLSNRVFENYEAIVEATCEAWNKLISQPQTITSIVMRDWEHVGQLFLGLVLLLILGAFPRESLNNRSFSCQRLPTAAGMHDPAFLSPLWCWFRLGFVVLGRHLAERSSREVQVG